MCFVRKQKFAELNSSSSHTRTRARAHTGTHARAHTHTHTLSLSPSLSLSLSPPSLARLLARSGIALNATFTHQLFKLTSTLLFVLFVAGFDFYVSLTCSRIVYRRMQLDTVSACLLLISSSFRAFFLSSFLFLFCFFWTGFALLRWIRAVRFHDIEN